MHSRFCFALFACLTLTALAACDEAGFADESADLGELSERSLAIPDAVALESIPARLPAWPSEAGQIVVLDDGADTHRVYAFQIENDAVVAVRSAPRYADLLRGQDIDLEFYPSDEWFQVGDDDLLLETGVSRNGARGNFRVQPPKPVGPRGFDPPSLMKVLIGFSRLATTGRGL